MGLLPKQSRNPNLRLVAFALATGVPLAAYLATASAHGYWYDAGEMTAASLNLDVFHPPGHPLAALLGKLFTFLPLGPIPFRVALGQAVLGSVAAGFLFSAIEVTVRSQGVRHESISVPLALGGSWLVSLSYAWWFQAVRPEVYALQAFLVCFALERIVSLEAKWPTLDLRPLYLACLALGLGLANHHLVAFLAIPALAPTLARVYRARGLRPLLISCGSALLGLSTYLYLPIRAATNPPANLGDPSSFGNFWWVISAQVYSSDIGLSSPQPIGERYADTLVLLVENLHTLPLLMALAGLYLLIRTPGARRVGYVWGAAMVINLLAPAYIGSVRSNPDILGYLMPGLAAIGALTVAFFGGVLGKIGEHPNGQARKTAVFLAIVAALFGLSQIKHSENRSSLAAFHATDDFDVERVYRLPLDSVVIAHNPQTVFRHWSVMHAEHPRDDVILVPLPFLNYPGVAQQLVDQHSDLRELVRGYLVAGTLREVDVQSLAAMRPVFVEMDVRVEPSLYASLLPDGLFYRVVEGGSTRSELLEAAEPQRVIYSRLYSNLGSNLADHVTTSEALWLHYMDALFYASRGALDPARRAVEAALHLGPEARELLALATLLNDPELHGPVDIGPFLVGVPSDTP